MAAPALSINGLKNDLVQFLLAKISVPGQFEIRARSVENDAAGRTVLVGVEVFDARGRWFDAQRIALAWSPARLLRGEVQIDQLEIADATLARLPQLPPPSPSASATPVARDARPGWPRSPITTHLKSVALKQFHISAEVLPQAVAFDARGNARDEGDVQQLALDVTRTDEVRGNINVRYTKRFAADELTLSVDASEAQGGLVAVLAGLPLDIPSSLQIEGTGSAADWRGKLALGAKHYVALRGSLKARWQTRIGAKLSLALTPGSRLPASARTAIGEASRLRLEIEEDAKRRVRIKQATLMGAVMTASATGHLQRDSGFVNLTTSGTINAAQAKRLRPLIQPLRLRTARFEGSLSGPPGALSARGKVHVVRPDIGMLRAHEAEISGAASQDANGVSVALAIAAVRPRSPEPAYAALLDKRADITLRGRLDDVADARVLTLETLTFAGTALEASASGEIQLTPTVQPAIQYRATLPQLSRLSKLASSKLAGQLRIRGNLTGKNAHLRAHGEAVHTQLKVNNANLGTVRLTHDLDITERLHGRINAVMDSPAFGQGKASTRLAVSASTLELKELVVDLLSIKAGGKLRLSRTGAPPAGNLDVNIRSLAPAGKLLGLALEGQAVGDVKLERKNRGTAQLNLTLEQLRNADLSLARGQLTVSITRLMTDQHLRGTLSASGALLGKLALNHVVINADGPVKALSLNLDATGEALQQALTLNSQMLVHTRASEQRIGIERLTLGIGAERITLQDPVRIRRHASGIELSPVKLMLPEQGRAAFDLDVNEGIVTTAAKLEGVPLRLVNLLTAELVDSGKLNGTLRARSAGTDAGLELEAKVSALRFNSAPPGVKPLAGRLRGAWDGKLAQASFVLSGPFETPVQAHLQVPFSARQRELPELDHAAAIDGAITWHGQTNDLLEQLPLPDHLLHGQAVVDIQIQGSLDKLELTGTAGVSNGRYENLATGTVLEQFTLSSRFDDQGHAELSVQASDEGGGTLQVDGFMHALSELDLKVEMQNLMAARLDQLAAQVDGKLKLTGTPEALQLKGEVNVRRAQISLLNRLPANVVDLGYVRVRGQESTLAAADSNPISRRVSLDVRVTMNDRIFVTGRGLDSEWGGALSIAGSVEQPLITGKIGVRRGRFDLLGRVLTFAKGELRFDGGADVDPLLEVRLERDANGIRGGVAVNGRASSPMVGFYSNPALPRDEVLPRLLFGRSSASLSGEEALGLAAGVAALTSGQSGAVDKIRAALGLDVLTLESGKAESAATSIAVGRYVRDGIYVGARQSLDGSTGAVVIEAEVFDNVVIDADLGRTGDTSVGVSWRKDF
jgi:translocation and assembly module TamB